MTQRSRVALSIGAALLTTVAVLSAHMKLTKTVPASGETLTAKPAAVQLTFNEKPNAAVSRISLSGAAGDVKLGSVHTTDEKTIVADVTGAMGDGDYSIKWQSAGDDGHVQKGEIPFSLRSTK
ncbi:MAG: copper resistance protein CopC [Vicinamibacterales bacterium]